SSRISEDDSINRQSTSYCNHVAIRCSGWPLTDEPATAARLLPRRLQGRARAAAGRRRRGARADLRLQNVEHSLVKRGACGVIGTHGAVDPDDHDEIVTGTAVPSDPVAPRFPFVEPEKTPRERKQLLLDTERIALLCR